MHFTYHHNSDICIVSYINFHCRGLIIYCIFSWECTIKSITCLWVLGKLLADFPSTNAVLKSSLVLLHCRDVVLCFWQTGMSSRHLCSSGCLGTWPVCTDLQLFLIFLQVVIALRCKTLLIMPWQVFFTVLDLCGTFIGVHNAAFAK